MTTTLPNRFEPFIVPGGLKGQISELPLPDILQHLRLGRSTGILSLVSGGARKALVEMGALSPKDLWEGVQFQVKEIVYSIFQWDEGQFHFEESSLPEKERITVDLDVRDLILAGLRRVDAGGRIQSRFPEGD